MVAAGALPAVLDGCAVGWPGPEDLHDVMLLLGSMPHLKYSPINLKTTSTSSGLNPEFSMRIAMRQAALLSTVFAASIASTIFDASFAEHGERWTILDMMLMKIFSSPRIESTTPTARCSP